MSLTTDLQVKEKTWRWNINCSYYHYSVDTLASTIGLVVLLNTTAVHPYPYGRSFLPPEYAYMISLHIHSKIFEPVCVKLLKLTTELNDFPLSFDDSRKISFCGIMLLSAASHPMLFEQ
jgi:hypothetical protein